MKNNLILSKHIIRWRAQPPALTENSCGCFLPDLTKFTTMQCGEARHNKLLPDDIFQSPVKKIGRNYLRFLVAGAGFEPTTFGL